MYIDSLGIRISTHTPLARRDFDHCRLVAALDISTHTPLARRDKERFLYLYHIANFYSHASREA